jgi:hypothetical protein
MEVQDFINLNNGKYVDYDGRFGFQCVDLMRQYLVDVLGLNGYAILGVSYAKQLFDKIPNLGDENFIKIKNTPTNYPQKGDIIIWGWCVGVTGYAGHVAIVSDATPKALISFDQNWPSNSPCRYVNHSYRGVLGWLRPRRFIKK